jgi:uncharacterized protein
MRVIIIAIGFIFIALHSNGQLGKPGDADSSKPFVLGVINEIQSKQLSEKRILNIYLPEGYHADDSVKYPVIYLLDGSADEDFIHIVGLVQFNSFSWVNRIPKSIVVGIANIDRRRDFTYPTTIEADKRKYPTTGGSGNFIAFIETELQPFIESRYKTSDSKTIIGESLGGLLATEILAKKPSLFSKYIIVSPSIWWDNGSILNQKFSELQKKISGKTEVYIGVGKEGPAIGNTHVMEADAGLLAKDLKEIPGKNLNIYFDYLPLEDHGTIMHQAVFNAFKLLYRQPDKQ